MTAPTPRFASVDANGLIRTKHLPSGTAGTVASTGITDSTVVGRSVLTAADALAARNAIALGSVDNTADQFKPVSDPAQQALNAKSDRSGSIGFVAWNGTAWPSVRPDYGAVFFLFGTTEPPIMNTSTDVWIQQGTI